jgi:uncharacterized repeat protein (TIGR01451 family)
MIQPQRVWAAVTFTDAAVAAGQLDFTAAAVKRDLIAQAVGTCDVGGGAIDPAIAAYISPEVDGTSAAARTVADTLDDPWRTAAGLPQTGTLQPWFGTTTGAIANSSPNLFTINGVSVDVTLVNLTPVSSCTGTVNSGSTPQLVQAATLQANAPRPSSLFDSLGNHPSYWNENVGSTSSRNAILFTFSQPVAAFGAWFGDVETRTDGNGTPALLRLLDASGNRIGNDIPVTPTTISNGGAFAPIDQSQCGSNALDRACGNSSTRWIGFVDASARVKQVLVIVGDDDFGDNGNTEHLSFIGANIVSAVTTSITGTIFADQDGNKLQNGTETGTNAGGLNAVLVDSANKVIATTSVAANGTYAFGNVSASAYTVLITTNAATVNSAPPTVALPSNWVNTGENLSNTPDATIDGKVSVTVSTSPVTGVNFGLDRLPDTTDLTPAAQANPSGTATVPVPTLAGIDSEDGGLGVGSRFKIVTLPTNGTLYYNGIVVTPGQVITSYEATKLTIDPNDGAITTSFTYAAVDAAGQADPTPATVTMPFTTAANVLLVKRITAINGDRTQNPNDNTPLNVFVDDTTSVKAADDNNSRWIANYLKGAINAGKVKPGDTIEYTIYFLNAGNANANNVRICDRIRPNQAFQPNGYGPGTGVQLQLGTAIVMDLTNANDSSDRTQFIAAGGSVPTNCNIASANTDGVIAVDLTGAIGTGNPALAVLPGATGAGSPNDSYGFFRLITKVNP